MITGKLMIATWVRLCLWWEIAGLEISISDMGTKPQLMKTKPWWFQYHPMYIAGHVGSIIYADQYGSIKIRRQVLIPMPVNKYLCRSIRINFDQF